MKIRPDRPTRNNKIYLFKKKKKNDCAIITYLTFNEILQIFKIKFSV